MEDCPTCFGKVELFGKTAGCASCEFAQSCRWYGENPDPVDRDGRLTDEHFVSLDARGGDWGEAAHGYAEARYGDDGDGLDDGRETPRWSDADMERLLFFFLREIDDYSLAILIHALRGNAESAVELGRIFGTSRQGMHRKLCDMAARHPQLADALRGVAYRCAKLSDVDRIGEIDGRRDANAKRREENEKRQMEFGF